MMIVIALLVVCTPIGQKAKALQPDEHWDGTLWGTHPNSNREGHNIAIGTEFFLSGNAT
jgi:hypothetical protein